MVLPIIIGVILPKMTILLVFECFLTSSSSPILRENREFRYLSSGEPVPNDCRVVLGSSFNGWNHKVTVFDRSIRLVDKRHATQKGFCREHRYIY